MARPPIGARARRFTLEMPVDTPDGFGGVVRAYQPGPQLWGAIEMVSEAERLRADRPESLVTHRVTLAWRDGVAGDVAGDMAGNLRLACGARRFRVQAATDPDGSRRDLVCLVAEIGP